MIEFRVEDMTSNLCVGTIVDAIKTVDQDALVEVDLKEHLVRVDSALAAEDIEIAISNLGYTPVVEPQQGW